MQIEEKDELKIIGECISIPKNPEHGDYSLNLWKYLKLIKEYKENKYKSLKDK